MKPTAKMKLSDLQPKPVTGIDWTSLDEFFNIDAPASLRKSLELSIVIKELNIIDIPDVNEEIILKYMQGIANDTSSLAHSFNVLRTKYNDNKARLQQRYDEDAHMYSIVVAHEMQEWTERYENTVALNISNLVDYINSVVPSEKQLTSAK